MKIRDHPNLVHWPPAWIEPLDIGILPFDEGEELVLKEVELLSSFANDYHSYIRISAEYGRKVGKIFGGLKTGKTYSETVAKGFSPLLFIFQVKTGVMGP
jgi:hypothetical protein